MSTETTQEAPTTPTEADEFAAGFSETEVPQERLKEEVAEEVTPETQEEVKEEPKEEVKEPETISITAEQWNALQSKLTEIDSFKQDAYRRIDQSLGKYGELNRSLQEIQKKPQGGLSLSKDKFKRLSQDFPEMAALLAEDLNEAFTAPPVVPEQQATSLDPAELEKRVQERVAKEIQDIALKNEMRELKRAHADWETVIQSPEFEQWGNTLPQDEWKNLVLSSDADTVADGITRFKAFKAKADAEQASALAREQKKQSASKRLEAAITPTGTAGGPPSKTDRDMFLEGFRSP